jgi:GNAT superfamily N-acetyltransferase
MVLAIRAATEQDVSVLAEMNKRLIEDEGHRNPMTVPELAERMRGWLHGSWNADLFMQPQTAEIVIGYALYQHRRDEHAPGRLEVYLRQFFIERAYRSRGFGRLALQLLYSNRFPPPCTVVVDVLVGNQRGLGFWQRVGFQPYQMTLKAQLEEALSLGDGSL